MAEPDDIGPLLGWWRADSITGVTDGGPVGAWPDSSPLARHATQSTPGARPVLDVDALNGQPGVVFDGADDYLSIFADVAGTPVSVFLVVRPVDAGPSSKGVVLGSPMSAPYTQVAHLNGLWVAYSGGSLVTESTSAAANTPTAVVAVFQQPGTPTELYIDGGALEYTPGVDQPGAFPTEWALGGMADGATDLFAGTLFEVAVFDAALSEEQRDALDAYVQGRYFAAGPEPSVGGVKVWDGSQWDAASVRTYDGSGDVADPANWVERPVQP